MKNIISLAVVLCFSITVKAQAIDMEANDYTYSSTFKSKSLSSVEIVGFQKRAVQKVKDLGDYLSIIANKKYDDKLRKQAIQIVSTQFLGDDVTIQPLWKKGSIKKTDLKSFLDACYQTTYSKVVVTHSKIKYLNNFQFIDDNKYSGKIQFNQKLDFYKEDKIVDYKEYINEVDIVLEKTQKKFGKRKETIWNVFLGSIRNIK